MLTAVSVVTIYLIADSLRNRDCPNPIDDRYIPRNVPISPAKLRYRGEGTNRIPGLAYRGTSVKTPNYIPVPYPN